MYLSFKQLKPYIVGVSLIWIVTMFFSIGCLLTYLDTKDVIYTTNPQVTKLCSVKRNPYDIGCYAIKYKPGILYEQVCNPEVKLTDADSAYLLVEQKEFKGKIFGDQSKTGRTILYLPANKTY